MTTPLNPQNTAGQSPTQPRSEAAKPRWKWPTWITIGGIVLLLFVGVSCGNAKSSTPTTTTTTPETQASTAAAPVTVPGDLVGKDAQLAGDELRRLGIINIRYVSQDGSKVAPLENWTVTKVEPVPGTVVLTTETVMITATKKHGPVAPVGPPAVSAPAPAPAAPVPPPADSGSPYYPNCAAARAAGAAPLHRGDPGYRPGLDRDGDGVACEK